MLVYGSGDLNRVNNKQMKLAHFLHSYFYVSIYIYIRTIYSNCLKIVSHNLLPAILIHFTNCNQLWGVLEKRHRDLGAFTSTEEIIYPNLQMRMQAKSSL
jgi:hypothetical protein